MTCPNPNEISLSYRSRSTVPVFLEDLGFAISGVTFSPRAIISLENFEHRLSATTRPRSSELVRGFEAIRFLFFRNRSTSSTTTFVSTDRRVRPLDAGLTEPIQLTTTVTGIRKLVDCFFLFFFLRRFTGRNTESMHGVPSVVSSLYRLPGYFFFGKIGNRGRRMSFRSRTTLSWNKVRGERRIRRCFEDHGSLGKHF